MTLTLRQYEGPQPPQVLFRGAWDVGTYYAPGHVAQAGSDLYQCIAETTGDDPVTDGATHWFRVYEGA